MRGDLGKYLTRSNLLLLVSTLVWGKSLMQVRSWAYLTQLGVLAKTSSLVTLRILQLH